MEARYSARSARNRRRLERRAGGRPGRGRQTARREPPAADALARAQSGGDRPERLARRGSGRGRGSRTRISGRGRARRVCAWARPAPGRRVARAAHARASLFAGPARRSRAGTARDHTRSCAAEAPLVARARAFPLGESRLGARPDRIPRGPADRSPVQDSITRASYVHPAEESLSRCQSRSSHSRRPAASARAPPARSACPPERR